MWTSSNKLFLPPPAPVARVLNTTEYVASTGSYYYGGSERLITVGHPFYPVFNTKKEKVVPHVSANQLRVFRVRLPDPNKLAFPDPTFYNPETHRLVWLLKALEIGRGGPLGVGNTGHPLMNKIDTENPTKYSKIEKDGRTNVSFDPKHCQLFVVGCKPCTGCYWGPAKACVTEHDPTKNQACPPIQLINTTIQDGDMGDIGLGNMDFQALQQDRSGAPLEICATKCLWPDFLKMQADVTGDACFFYGRKESLYARHMFGRSGKNGEAYPNEVEPGSYVLPTADTSGDRRTAQTPVYFTTPSGSLNSSDGQLFNRAYFLRNSQGTNNGVLWNNDLFITLMDNSHNTNFTISVTTPKAPQFDANQIKYYNRHAEIFELMFVVELGKIELKGNILAHINAMHPSVIESWQLGLVPMPSSSLEDAYRTLTGNLATKCSEDVTPPKPDLYEQWNFWNVDVSEKLTTELERYPLGRKFLAQKMFKTPRAPQPVKRKLPTTRKTAAKRKRT